MITAIIGLPRVGKTSLKTHFACEHMTALARDDLAACKVIVKRLNAGGFHYTVPDKHIVYADYPITAKQDGFKRRHSYKLDSFSLGLPNDHQPTAFLPPHAKIFLDEFQKVANSRDFKNFPDWVSRLFELHGHNYWDIWVTVQRIGLIDINIRDIIGKIIEVKNLSHRYNKYDELTSSTWTCIEFDSIAAYDDYAVHGKRAGGTHTTYNHEGNIFAAYDSRNFLPLFYRGRADADFDRELSNNTAYTLESFNEFNSRVTIERPESYTTKRSKR